MYGFCVYFTQTIPNLDFAGFSAACIKTDTLSNKRLLTACIGRISLRLPVPQYTWIVKSEEPWSVSCFGVNAGQVFPLDRVKQFAQMEDFRGQNGNKLLILQFIFIFYHQLVFLHQASRYLGSLLTQWLWSDSWCFLRVSSKMACLCKSISSTVATGQAVWGLGCP